jgi:hypothetical protein
LKFVNNELSDESISLGLLMLCDNKTYFKISERKLGIAKKLNGQGAKLVEFAIKQIEEYFTEFKREDAGKLFYTEKVDPDYIKRLSIYNNGIIQFSKLAGIITEDSENIFNKYFSNLVDSLTEEKTLSGKSAFQLQVESKLYVPLRDRVDVDFTIRSEQIPSLFFDYHLDSVGVNGAMYAVKAIDFKKEEGSPMKVKAKIAEFETLIDRLDNIAHHKGISGANNCFLIVDPYHGSSAQLNDLYSLLEREEMPHFKMVAPDKIESIVDLIIEKGARKISTDFLR